MSSPQPGLVKAEERDIARHAQAQDAAENLTSGSTVQSSTGTPGIQRHGAPLSIAIDNPTASPNRRLRSMSSLSSSVPATPGGHIIGVATPAMTPAILPAVSSSRREASGVWPGSA